MLLGTLIKRNHYTLRKETTKSEISKNIETYILRKYIRDGDTKLYEINLGAFFFSA